MPGYSRGELQVSLHHEDAPAVLYRQFELTVTQPSRLVGSVKECDYRMSAVADKAPISFTNRDCIAERTRPDRVCNALELIRPDVWITDARIHLDLRVADQEIHVERLSPVRSHGRHRD